MNLLPPEKLASLEKSFNEGRGIRETERLTGVHRDTVSRYFRLFSDPAKEPDDGPSGQNFECVEHNHDWHIFCWHDLTPEWWRHLAVFHSERRARDYVADLISWADVVQGDREDAETEGHPLPDEEPAPLGRVPEPPPALPPLTREERAAERERRWDEQSATLPERRCQVCDVVLSRRPGEAFNGFAVRKTCSMAHAKELIARLRKDRVQGAPVVEVPLPDARPNGLATDDSTAIDDSTVEHPAEVQPPGYRECPDCVWSGTIIDYRDHRRLDHG